MKLTIKHLYEYQFVPSGHQKHRKAMELATVEIDIKEVSSDQAPAVYEVANKLPTPSLKIGDGYERFTELDGRARRIRLFNGKFYVEAYDIERFIEEVSRLETLNNTILGRSGYDYVCKPGLVGYDKVDKVVKTLGMVRRQWDGLREDLTKNDYGQRVGGILKTNAEKVIFVDGAAYEECREPILALKAKDDDIAAGIVEAPVNIKNRRPGYRESYQHKVFALDWTASLPDASRFADKYKLSPELVSFKAFDSTVSGYSAVDMDVMAHVDQIIEVLAGELQAMPLSALSLFYDLRQAFAVQDIAMPIVTGKVIETLQAMRSVVPEPELDAALAQIEQVQCNKGPQDKHLSWELDTSHAQNYGDAKESLEMAKYIAAGALSRWQNRSPEFDLIDAPENVSSVSSERLIVSRLDGLQNIIKMARSTPVSEQQVAALLEANSVIFMVKDAESAAVALVASGADGDMGGWSVFDRDEPELKDALDAVLDHVENQKLEAAQNAYEAQTISM
jgi:hypothetical protein